MERIEPQHGDTEAATRVWSVTEFCVRHRLDNEEEARLLRLFGPFATACELRYNAKRAPKWR
ncbi:hypothetical protein PYH37_001706 [Sinorhizobium numidicum]|uniref:Uncharacterized protein n=1 Tax=Sinorhizobium numidicum TaxID=680248 RepID=A0ABY8CSW1_9HYPH|nr:hypothetical protein [Sinorhizobium numidicum]WEX74302.1 hypothetical protein PYH37_001706 [Sinorhizobium numidicum]WEX80288.1 hypothetical protein PYH38_001707 [Sinorhizobium numidicum]